MVYAALLHLYPAGFRRQAAAEMLEVFVEMRSEGRYGGASGVIRLWVRLLWDLVRSAGREHREAWRAGRAARRAADPFPPPYGEAGAAALAVWLLYVVTLAPTVAFWDAGEYITAAHVMGTPHPPGSSLFVVLARAWEVALFPLGLPVAVVINLFSATLSAAAHGCWFLLADRLLAGTGRDRPLRRAGAWAGVLLSATAFTVWSQSNVNEKVYTVSFLTIAAVSWLLVRWRDGGYGPRRLLLIGYLLVLSSTNHLMGLLAAPAVLVFTLAVRPRVLLSRQLWAGALPLAAIALTAHLFLPVRSELKPLVLEGEPTCETLGGALTSIYTGGAGGCDALSAMLTREQYGEPPSVFADRSDPTMPRTPALFGAQLLNWLQYFDWQWAKSVAGERPVLGGVRPLVTAVMILLGLLGLHRAWRRDRALGAYLAVLFATLSLGLVVYLNFRYGWSIGWDRFPGQDRHEVRERDYFFLIGFSLWGVLAGIGLAVCWRWVGAMLERATRPRQLALPLLGLALLPLALNWSWASRAEDWTARDWAYNVLMSVEPYGILVTNGDNDSFPLWYLQKVERLREDVTIVLTPYLNLDWYPRQIRDLTRTCPKGVSAADDPSRIICQRALDPSEFPAPLVAAGILEDVQPPVDSVLPLTDQEIDQLATTAFVSREALRLRAGRIDTVIPAGTTILPQDSFITVLLRANVGRRPIHFMASPGIAKLGLAGHAVRHGLTYRIVEDLSDHPRELVRLPREYSGQPGAWIDLARTDTLLQEVFLRRGRITDPDSPWVDAAVRIPGHYASAHWAAAQGWAMQGREDQVLAHAAGAEEWEGLLR